METTEPYKYSTELLINDPEASAMLGPPVKIGWRIIGAVNESGKSGDAELSIPVKGSMNKGTLYVIAKKTMDAWHYDSIQLGVEGQSSRLDLLHHIMVQPEER